MASTTSAMPRLGGGDGDHAPLILRRGLMAAGAIPIVLAVQRGPVLHRDAGWDRALAW